MTALFANHFIPVMRPNLDANQIPHAAGRHKQSCLFPEHLRRALLQPVDRGIFSIHVIANFGFRHRPPHLRRRPRHRVASQIHHAFECLPADFHLIRINSLVPLCHRVTHVCLFSFTAKSPGSLRNWVTFFSLLCLLSSLTLYFISSTNTSFEMLSLSSARRTTLPCCSTNP